MNTLLGECTFCKDDIFSNDNDVLRCTNCRAYGCSACTSPNGSDFGVFADEDSPDYFCSKKCLNKHHLPWTDKEEKDRNKGIPKDDWIEKKPRPPINYVNYSSQ
jgi:hypothetical protein